MDSKTESGMSVSQTDGFASQTDTSDMQAEMTFKNYMQKQYGDLEYQVDGIVYAGWNQNYDEMTASLLGSAPGDGTFKVRRYVSEQGEYFTDTYMGLLIRPQLESKISCVAKSYLGQCEVFADSNQLWISDVEDRNMTLEDAVAAGAAIDCSVWICTDERWVKAEKFDAAVENFIEEWKDENMPVTFSIYLLKDGVLDRITRENCYDISGNDMIAYKTVQIKE